MNTCIKFLIGCAISLIAIHSFSQNSLTPEILWKLGRVNGGDVSPDGKKALYSVTRYDIQQNSGNTAFYILDLTSGQSTQLENIPTKAFEVRWKNNQTLVFLHAPKGPVEVFAYDIKNNSTKSLSQFSKSVEGYLMSHDGNQLVVLQTVANGTALKDRYPEYPKAQVRSYDDLMYRHWNQWSEPSVTHLFHAKMDGKGVWLDGVDLLNGEPYSGVSLPFGGSEGLQWAGNHTIYYTSKKKVGKEFALSTDSDIYAFNVKTGKTAQITPSGNGYDHSPKWSDKTNKLAFLSMARNGFESDKNAIRIYNPVNKSIRDLKLMSDLTVDDFQWAKDGKGFYFIAPFKGVNQFFYTDLNGKVTSLTTGKSNVVHFSETPTGFVLAMQSLIAPTDLFWLDKKSKKIKRLTEVNGAIWDQIAMPTVKEKWIKTSDGKEMLTWVLLPPTHKEGQKHPTLLYCQGGPQSMVSQFFSYRWNLMLMASQGYVVIAPNRRGLPGFGKEWNDAISKDWGGQPMRDYLAAVDEISTETYVDTSRRGAVGASYGGYSVYYLAGIHENRFKTFVSHCGLFNLESWYGMTEELFFANWDIGGPYWKPENKELYEKNSPHKMVQKWNTPILVIHGGMDFRVPEAEGMQAFQAAQLLGIKSRFLHFPTEGHWVQKPQNGLVWQAEFFKWLSETL